MTFSGSNSASADKSHVEGSQDAELVGRRDAREPAVGRDRGRACRHVIGWGDELEELGHEVLVSQRVGDDVKHQPLIVVGGAIKYRVEVQRFLRERLSAPDHLQDQLAPVAEVGVDRTLGQPCLQRHVVKGRPSDAAIVYGLALMIPDVDQEAARYLSSGAWTLGIIAVGCVLAPQIMSTSKQEGLLDYQKTHPVPRSAILLADADADAVVWSLAALPGIVVGRFAAFLRFGLDIDIDLFAVAAILGAQFTAVSIGYAIALWLPIGATSLAIQAIMIGELLFSPITFPAERLPEWSVALHQLLPFTPLGDIIREATFRTGENQFLNIIVVAVWAGAAYLAAYLALRKRK